MFAFFIETIPTKASSDKRNNKKKRPTEISIPKKPKTTIVGRPDRGRTETKQQKQKMESYGIEFSSFLEARRLTVKKKN